LSARLTRQCAYDVDETGLVKMDAATGDHRPPKV